MRELYYINMITLTIFSVCLAYQGFYVIVSLFKKQKKFKSKKNHRYAVIVSARNESGVITQLIESIKWQKYPKKLIDIFVVADNCTDNTADVARKAGAIVYERFNKIEVGKGYALDYLFSKIKKDYAHKNYEGYIIFDADNIADENYVAEMNNVFDNGYNVVTSYRNSKNFTESWISSGYSLWFLKEARYLNNPRMTLKTSCAVSGTGFLVSTKTIDSIGGWKFFTLTEDIEFTFNRVVNGDLIGYAEDAIFYDEQPTSFDVSIKQRSRWIKGAMQVVAKYSVSILKKMFQTGDMSSYDMFMNTVPTMVIGCIGLFSNVFIMLFEILTKAHLLIVLGTLAHMFFNTYITVALLAVLIVITERKRIKATKLELIKSILTFPLFVSTYVIAFFVAVFKDVKWEPIPHKASFKANAMKKS
ncbi:MAG: glycosyltransferase family 2 protein [Clostridia bacterium]